MKSKPLGIFMSPCPQEGVRYKASYPTNWWQTIRLGVARTLIKWGYRLVLWNSEIQYKTGTT